MSLVKQEEQEIATDDDANLNDLVSSGYHFNNFMYQSIAKKSNPVDFADFGFEYRPLQVKLVL